VQGPVCACLQHGGGADVQHPRGSAQATGLPGPSAALGLPLRRWPRVGLRQQAGPPRPARRAAAGPLLAGPGLALADNLGALTVGTVKHLKAHDATQWLGGDYT
jgi:hypothetical protein